MGNNLTSLYALSRWGAPTTTRRPYFPPTAAEGYGGYY
jgi:hypothetical protein